MGTTSSSSPPRRSRSLDIPRVLAFYRDVLDDDGTVIGWRTIAWGLAMGDGSAISIPVGRPVSLTLWSCLDDAATALDAHIDTPDPRHAVDDLSADSVPSRASTAPPPQPVDGTAALAACPDDPDAGEGRDRPLGASGPSSEGPGPIGGGRS